MAETVVYHPCMISPWTYLGGPRFAEIVARRGVAAHVAPIRLATVFPATGGLALAKRGRQRQDYRLVELRRWRTFLNMPLNLQPKYFPADETPAIAFVVAARERGDDALALTQAILRAVWAEDRDPADAQELLAIANETGLDGDAIAAAARAPEIAVAAEAETRAAIAAGVFAAPTYVYKGELFWGQDRLELLDRTLEAGGSLADAAGARGA